LSRRAKGFTLLELLVAMGIFLVLGTSLMVILRGGLATWRRSEARQESFAAAQSLVSQLAEDLRSTVAPHDTPLEGMGDVEARMLCDTDAAGRQRLFLVRTLKAESEHPITGLAGTTIGADRNVDYREDLEEARESRLRATGGAMEVAWVMGPDDVLYRGVKAPPGPPGSLFADEDPYELSPPTATTPTPAGATPAAVAAPRAPDADLPPLLRPFAMNVIHLEFRFWTQYSTSWDPTAPPRRRTQANEKSGPLLYWDSTRAVLAPEDDDRRRFDTFVSRASLADPRDDVFPAKVRVELTVREHPAAGSSTFLTRPASRTDTELYVQDPGRLPPGGGHLLLDREWVKYDEVQRDRVVVSQNGRGARGTAAVEHDLVEVVVGRSFVVIVDVPAWREDWSDREQQP
jgi:prepilin-type N-terminal cleavage/methylation domain-containing protein